MVDAGDDPVTYEAFCPQCDEERPVMRTVPWQDDVCVTCGSDIDRGGTD